MKQQTLQEIIYKDLNKVIGFNWRRLRQEHGLSIFELCMKTGLNHAVTGDIERGKNSRISIDICEQLADFYEMTIEDLIFELTKGISELSIPGKDITRANLQDVFPYNLLTMVYGQTPEMDDVSLKGLGQLLELLTDKERLVVDLRFRQGLSTERTAVEANMNKERVRTLEAKVLAKMRSSGWRKLLKSYTYDDVINAMEHGSEIADSNSLRNNSNRSLLETEKTGLQTIEKLDFSMRTYHVLKRYGCQTIGDVDKAGKKELRQTRGCGKKALDEIAQKMRDLGYDW